jgi:hypothetical protein
MFFPSKFQSKSERRKPNPPTVFTAGGVGTSAGLPAVPGPNKGCWARRQLDGPERGHVQLWRLASAQAPSGQWARSPPGVNATNILRTAFLRKCFAQLFSNYSLSLYFCRKIIGAKAAPKMLVKLTTGQCQCLRGVHRQHRGRHRQVQWWTETV